MERSRLWKTVFLALLVVLSCAYLAPSVLSADKLPGWYGHLFSKKVKLGLDLQGGEHIVYGINFDKLLDDKAGDLKRDMDVKLKSNDKGGLNLDATVETPRQDITRDIPLGAILVTPKNPDDLKTLDSKKFLADYEDLVEKFKCPADHPKSLCVRVSTDYADRVKSSALEQAIKTTRDRVDALGVADVTVIKKGEDIIVEIPGKDETANEHIREQIDRQAQLEFKIVDDATVDKSGYMQKLAQHVNGDAAAKAANITTKNDYWVHEESGAQHEDYYLTAADTERLMDPKEAQDNGCSTQDRIPTDGKYLCPVSGRKIIEDYLKTLPADLQPDSNHELGFEQVESRDPTKKAEKSWRTYYLERAAGLTGTAIKEAEVTWNPTSNRPEVLVRFDHEGTGLFGDMTSKHVGWKMAIILDQKIQSAPVIQSAITGGSSTITMGASDPRVLQREAEDLVAVLRTGSLPAPLVEKSSSKVGAMLGQDAIDRAKLSMGVGAVLVIMLMIFFYRFSGVIANGAMVLNVLFQVAILAAFQATLTLPGIAGLVLTIGMAVDSNIIIYERVREELRAGKTVRGAVDAGFGRAFWTVFDAHVTNFVAGFVLMEYGTGPIRGFAVTLLIGVVCNLFTSTWVSRLMFDYYVGRKKALAELSI